MALKLLHLTPSPNSGSLSLRTLEEPHPLSLFFLTFSLTPLLLFSTRKGKARLFSQQKQCLLTFGKKKNEEISQRSFKIMVFEYLKTMNARNIDRSCVRLHSDLSAHYLVSKNRSSSTSRGLVQSTCAVQPCGLSAPSPAACPSPHPAVLGAQDPGGGPGKWALTAPPPPPLPSLLFHIGVLWKISLEKRGCNTRKCMKASV